MIQDDFIYTFTKYAEDRDLYDCRIGNDFWKKKENTE